MIQLIWSIAICAYLQVGYSTAGALAHAYDKAHWWRLYLVVLGWPLYLLWAILGMLIEAWGWIHGQMFPKE